MYTKQSNILTTISQSFFVFLHCPGGAFLRISCALADIVEIDVYAVLGIIVGLVMLILRP